MLPDIVKKDGIRKTVQVAFGGLDLRPDARDGSFAVTKNLSSDRFPLLASRGKRRAVLTESQIQCCDIYGMGEGLVLNVDGFLYYNGVAVGEASSQGGGRLIPFGNKIVLPWSREILDLTYRPKGYAASAAALPANPSAGDAYVVAVDNVKHMYVYEAGAWQDKGPILKSLEASVTIDELQAEFCCGSYQGEAAEWNTIRSYSGVDLTEKFKAGDALTIQGCVSQPFNNQTLIVREVTETELRFYENSFKQAYLGRYEFYPDDFTDQTPFRILGGDIPIYGENAFFWMDNEVMSGHTTDPDAPDVAIYCKPDVWGGAEDNPQVSFFHWDKDSDSYEWYASVIVVDTSVHDPTVEGYVDLYFTTQDKYPTPGAGASSADKWYYEDEITISRKWPEGIQGVFADSNRLWGLAGREIRASKLGDPGNWNFFDGTAEDAWAVEVHDPDPFTGGISVHGYPTFFTENKRYRVYGSEPEAYQLGEQDCNGVRSGCGDSLAAFDGALYYVSTVGVMQDSGSTPVCVSEALGLLRLKNAVGGGQHERYYVSGTDQDGKRHNLVLDTRNGAWIDEGDRDVRSYAAAAGIMHEAAFTGSNEDELTVWAYGAGSPLGNGTEEGAVEAEAVTNDYTMAQPNRKRVHRVQLRFVIGAGAGLAVSIQYDGDGTWHAVQSIEGDGIKRSVYLPVIPRRCDHFKLRFAGSGDWELHSLALDLRQGSAIF